MKTLSESGRIFPNCGWIHVLSGQFRAFFIPSSPTVTPSTAQRASAQCASNISTGQGQRPGRYSGVVRLVFRAVTQRMNQFRHYGRAFNPLYSPLVIPANARASARPHLADESRG
jgi:hypothetical protein